MRISKTFTLEDRTLTILRKIRDKQGIPMSRFIDLSIMEKAQKDYSEIVLEESIQQ